MTFTDTTLASADRTPDERSALQRRWKTLRKALAKRNDLTDAELEAEEHLLVAQAQALASELGLQSTNMGKSWSRTRTIVNEEHST